MLEDGRYETVVVDANADGEAVSLELTVVAGDHKGEVVTVRATALRGEPLDLLGMPATLDVTDGVPSVHIEH